MIKIPEHVQKLQPYKAGKPIEELAREKGIKNIVKLASNENPLGPSPKAVEEIKKHLNELHRYTNPSAYQLVNAIAARYNKKPAQIVTASGSDALLQYLITAFSDENDELISSQGTFIGWYVNANKYGRKSTLVPLKDYHFDLEGILERVNKKTKIIYLANPNNPTGTMITKTEFENFMKKVPGWILVVLDEAYTVYAESNPEYPNGLNYDQDNLLVTRTLSKAYGLAGIRIGFGYGKEYLIKELYKVKLPFEPNELAQVAAIAALTDDEFVARTVELNKKSLTIMGEKFKKLGINYVPTSANFFLLLFPDESFTIEFNNGCLNMGLILRHVNTFGIPNGIRINSGTMEETDFALKVIEEVYCKMTDKYNLQVRR